MRHSPSTVLIHRSLFAELGLFDTDLPVCEDYDVWLRITAKYPVLLITDAQIKNTVATQTNYPNNFGAWIDLELKP